MVNYVRAGFNLRAAYVIEKFVCEQKRNVDRLAGKHMNTVMLKLKTCRWKVTMLVLLTIVRSVCFGSLKFCFFVVCRALQTI